MYLYSDVAAHRAMCRLFACAWVPSFREVPAFTFGSGP